jgi:hypothetical protein
VLAKAFVRSSPNYAPAVRPMASKKAFDFRGLATSARNSSREKPKNRAPTPGASSSASPVAKTNIRPPKSSGIGDFCRTPQRGVISVQCCRKCCRVCGDPASRKAQLACCRMSALGHSVALSRPGLQFGATTCGVPQIPGAVQIVQPLSRRRARSTFIASRRARSVSDRAPGPIASSDRR